MIQTLLTLGLADQGCLIPDDAFASAQFEEPYRYERVNGRLVVMSPSGKTHNRMITAILERLYVYKHTTPGIVEMVVPEAWMRTAESTDRMADIAVYLTADEPQPDVQYETIPAIVFEIISKGSEERDYIAKREEYHRFGVREYIILDPLRNILTILTRDRQDYRTRELKPDDTYTSPQLPGFGIFLKDLPW